LQQLADELGVSLAKLSIAWCLRNPHVSSVILGASRPEQLRENLGALEVVKNITPEVQEKIETVLGNKPLVQMF
jgi:aryl-alcohol dehydrogenase-like predicted oxidoreductase